VTSLDHKHINKNIFPSTALRINLDIVKIPLYTAIYLNILSKSTVTSYVKAYLPWKNTVKYSQYTVACPSIIFLNLYLKIRTTLKQNGGSHVTRSGSCPKAAVYPYLHKFIIFIRFGCQPYDKLRTLGIIYHCAKYRYRCRRYFSTKV